jgi:hypothetical protein
MHDLERFVFSFAASRAFGTPAEAATGTASLAVVSAFIPNAFARADWAFFATFAKSANFFFALSFFFWFLFHCHPRWRKRFKNLKNRFGF